ncbi:hypothetical protein PIB30_063607 [Stylosanthes scabra]|uniref:Uncharacterized protein n=1 Tax=Stylosanthes scabra TaxID=79078 RepID=A0ABU6VNF1_9FABA|nr:hypothetical protein [Stylosanthes scabra]
MYALALKGKTSPKLLTSHSIILISNSIAWSFIPRGNDTHFTVVLLVRFGALAEIGVYQDPHHLFGVPRLKPKTFDSGEPYLGLTLSNRRVREMGSGVIYYEYEKRGKFEDFGMKADVELGTFKIRRYHLDDEAFVHPLHSVRIDPDLSVRESGTRSAILRLDE